VEKTKKLIARATTLQYVPLCMFQSGAPEGRRAQEKTTQQQIGAQPPVYDQQGL
jgi:hypothetical protein